MPKPRDFTYLLTADGRLLVSWRGRAVAVVKGAAATQLAAKLKAADEDGVQLLLARNTGNFKRGNERP